MDEILIHPVLKPAPQICVVKDSHQHGAVGQLVILQRFEPFLRLNFPPPFQEFQDKWGWSDSTGFVSL